MLRLVNLEELQNSLQLTPKLIDLLAVGDSRFVFEVKQWLVEVERIFTSNQLPQVGKLASLRGSVIAGGMGIPAGLLQSSQLTRTKLKNSVALDALKQAIDVVFHSIQKDIDRITEAQRIMSQLIAVSNSKGILNDFPAPPVTTEILKSYWNILSRDNDLSPGVVSIEGLVGPYDSLIIFNRFVKSC